MRAALLNAVLIIFTTSFIDSITALGTENEPALPLFQSLSEFHLDEESRFIGNLAFRERVLVAGDVAYQYFGFNVTTGPAYDGPCPAICLERGTHISHLLHPLPYHQNLEGEDIANWISQSCQQAEVGFINYADQDANIYFVTNDGEEINTGLLKQKEVNTVWQQSFLGHAFRIRSVETNEVLLEFEVEFNSIHSIGRMINRDVPVPDVEAEVEYFLKDEMDRALDVKRTFTEIGFARSKLPLDLFGSMSAYHYNNMGNMVPEEWNDGGVIVNWWEADVYMIHMPFEYWQSRLQVLVEAWAGVELELTDIYGMRRYEDGARLLTHVDRVHTHAASLIVNVAQSAIRKPWKVEIYDFAGRLHEVEMDEGDIVYYESARCLHGRMQPLHGGYYVNLFSHYRPVGDPQWFTRPNPEGTPEHLLEVGECSSNGTKATCTGVSEAVLPFLSPKMDWLSEPTDLFKFWRKITDSEAGQGDQPATPHEEL
eukprot:gene25940-34539_t